MPMNRDQYIENFKKGNTVICDPATAAEANHHMIEELLTVMEPALRDMLDSASGDVSNMFPEEQGMWEVYKSWDHWNKGRGRKTTEELLAPYQNEGDEDAPD